MAPARVGWSRRSRERTRCRSGLSGSGRVSMICGRSPPRTSSKRWSDAHPGRTAGPRAHTHVGGPVHRSVQGPLSSLPRPGTCCPLSTLRYRVLKSSKGSKEKSSMSTTTLAFPTPASLGSIDHYIQAVNRFPLLTAEQEVEFGRRLRDHNDLDAARQLVLSHLRLVDAVSRKYVGYGLPQAGLIQEGSIGLMKAVRRFDPERGVRLVSFALHWIRAEIHEYILRNWRLVKIATTKAQRKLFFNLRSMKQSAGTMSREEIEGVARELNVKPEEVAEMETRMGGGEVALEGRLDDGSEQFAPINYLADGAAEPVAV